jgi:hypothetical protein
MTPRVAPMMSRVESMMPGSGTDDAMGGTDDVEDGKV